MPSRVRLKTWALRSGRCHHLCCCSILQSCLTLCDPMDGSMLGFLSFTNSQSLLKLASIESVILSNHLILCHHLPFLPSIFPSIGGSFPTSWHFESSGHGIGASASASVLPMNIQGWFPLGLTDLSSLQFEGFSSVFSSTAIQKMLK